MYFHKSAALGFLIATASIGHATVLIFDDVAPDTPLTNEYSSRGVLSDGASVTRAGLSNGDPGNWGLEGTNGSNFLGNNGNNNFTTTFFLTGAWGISFDISRSGGSDSNDQWIAQEFDASSHLLDTQTATFNGINSWTHVAFTRSGVAKLVIASLGSGFHPYGVDNVVFSSGQHHRAPSAGTTNLDSKPGAVPEPATMSALAFGVLAFARRRRSR